mmetsp:Transcript_8322/g.19588  ORF Transcript_8322/g.19588 Transcript_8322/m.19588 type:complete len:266 (-) Transcript_8322:141-938(-)
MIGHCVTCDDLTRVVIWRWTSGWKWLSLRMRSVLHTTAVAFLALSPDASLLVQVTKEVNARFRPADVRSQCARGAPSLARSSKAIQDVERRPMCEQDVDTLRYFSEAVKIRVVCSLFCLPPRCQLHLCSMLGDAIRLGAWVPWTPSRAEYSQALHNNLLVIENACVGREAVTLQEAVVEARRQRLFYRHVTLPNKVTNCVPVMISRNKQHVLEPLTDLCQPLHKVGQFLRTTIVREVTCVEEDVRLGYDKVFLNPVVHVVGVAEV